MRNVINTIALRSRIETSTRVGDDVNIFVNVKEQTGVIMEYYFIDMHGKSDNLCWRFMESVSCHGPWKTHIDDMKERNLTEVFDFLTDMCSKNNSGLVDASIMLCTRDGKPIPFQ